MKPLYEVKESLQFSYRIHKLDFPLHLHDAVEIFLFTEGSSCITCEANTYHLSKGDIFLSFPNQLHSYTNSQDVQGYLLIIPMSPHLTPFRNTLQSFTPTKPFLRAGQWEQSGVLSLVEQAFRDFRHESDTVMHGFLLVILGKLLSLLSLQPIERGNSVLKSVLLYLNTHYREPLTRKDLSHILGYSESYLSHIFSDALKTTIPAYINTLRIHDACQLLEQTQLPVSQIALDLGFGSIRSFNRAFTRHTGKTPSDYRASAQSDTFPPVL